MAEELALDEGFGDGAAVEGDERLLLPGAVVVDGLRDQFLSRPALPGDQDVGLGGGHLLEEVIKGEHLWTLTDDVVEHIAVSDDLLQAGRSPSGGASFQGHS